jgi:hypothetical protein
VAREVLGAACRATGLGAQLELYGSGSLYQRLGPRHGPPPPDIVMWFGPYAARAAALDDLLQPHQPARVSDGVAHDDQWRWVALDYSPIRAVGTLPIQQLDDIQRVPRLAIADPERSEAGVSILLASLDRARQMDGDAEQAWIWWQQRVRAGIVYAEDDAEAVTLALDNAASHALTLQDSGDAVVGLAPLPHAIGLAANSQNIEAARRMLDWLTSEAAAGALRTSPWQFATNGLAGLLAAAPPLDIEWAGAQYSATRRRWAQSGFGPVLTG